MPKINYQVRSSANGAIVGTRSSHRTYTHALVVTSIDGKVYVPTWCGSLELARKASFNRAYIWNAAHVSIEEVEIVAPKGRKPVIDVDQFNAQGAAAIAEVNEYIADRLKGG